MPIEKKREEDTLRQIPIEKKREEEDTLRQIPIEKKRTQLGENSATDSMEVTNEIQPSVKQKEADEESKEEELAEMK